MDFSALGQIFLFLLGLFFIACTIGFWILRSEIRNLRLEAVTRGHAEYYKNYHGVWTWTWK